MRAIIPPADTSIIAAQYERAYGAAELRQVDETYCEATADVVAAILDEAARFATDFLTPLNDVGDRIGCRMVDGRVVTVEEHRAAYAAFRAAGWPSLDLPEKVGGQGLPLALAFAAQEVFDRACPAFGMLPVPQRSAARVLSAFGADHLREQWLPQLSSGEWAATICISEAGAGSDVPRMKTRATIQPDGLWAINGEKMWISFGDHDLTERIGHMVLARTAGQKGLSLFLVPDRIDGERNGVMLRRVEEKLGLHASPTCAIGFEDARGWLVGEEGRGLQQMFVMITNMRLATGAQGLGIASSAADVARLYARDRAQGGVEAEPTPIENHADVQRMLLEQAAQVVVLRGLLLATANIADLSQKGADPAEREQSAALLQWLLPLVKTTGGEFAFEVASSAIQVLGGAGYTREWPVEQAMRDARVLTIFEGTTGIQALDLLHRRVRRGGAGLSAFLELARRAVRGPQSHGLVEILDHLEEAAATLAAMTPLDAECGATAFLHLAALAATSWIAADLSAIDQDDPTSRHLKACGQHWLLLATTMAPRFHADAVKGRNVVQGFAELTRT